MTKISYHYAEPKLEKRILPLLDVALTVMGMLLVLLVTATMEEQAEGEEAGLVITLSKNGIFKFQDKILAENNRVDDALLQNVCDQALERDPPRINIEYPPLDGKLRDSNSALQKIVKRFGTEGIDCTFQERQN